MGPLEVAFALEILSHSRPLPHFFMKTIIQLYKRNDSNTPIILRYVLSWIDTVIKRQIWDDKFQWSFFIDLINDLGDKALPALDKMPKSGLKKLLESCQTGTRRPLSQRLLNYTKKLTSSRLVVPTTVQAQLNYQID